ncbi:MAG: tetratricopeptide repeat protein [Elusimicrobiota bacterium]
MNVKNLVNQKLEDVSNIPNVNRTLLKEKIFKLFNDAKNTLEDGNLRGCSFFLSKIHFSSLPRPNQIDYLLLKLELSQIQGDFFKAIKYGKKALSLIKKFKDEQNYAQVLLKLGDNHRQIEKFFLAIKYYRRVISLNARLKTPIFKRYCVDAYLGEGMCLRGLGKWDDAQKLFKICLKYYEKNKDFEGQAYTLWAIGTTFRFSGQIAFAEYFLKKSLIFYKKIKDDNGLAYARCGLGGTFRMKGFPQESLALYSQAYRYFQSQHDEFGLAYSSCGQGNAFRMMGNLNRAVSCMNRAIKKYSFLNQTGPLAFVLWSRAQLNISRKFFLQARKDLKKSEVLFKKCSDKRGLVYCLLGFGELNLNKNFSSIHYFKKAFNQSKKLKLQLEAGHAASRFNKNISQKIYSSCGVSVKSYFHYKGFP